MKSAIILDPFPGQAVSGNKYGDRLPLAHKNFAVWRHTQPHPPCTRQAAEYDEFKRPFRSLLRALVKRCLCLDLATRIRK
jgi:hypothetical protein